MGAAGSLTGGSDARLETLERWWFEICIVPLLSFPIRILPWVEWNWIFFRRRAKGGTAARRFGTRLRRATARAVASAKHELARV